MHSEWSEECIIHEPIVHQELTDLIHGFGRVICNKRDLYPIHLVQWFRLSGGQIHLAFCYSVEWNVFNYYAVLGLGD